jgi:hypothetical protein
MQLKPQMDELIRFIYETHLVEKLNCPMEAITQALKRAPNPNPYVVGHFDAINYLMTLIDNPDVPAKAPDLLTNVYRSDEALFWVKEMHAKMTLPLAQASHLSQWEDELNRVKQYECGVLRNVPVALAFSMAPPPHLLPYILHNWLNQVGTLHAEVKDKVNNPYGLTREKAAELAKTSYNTLLLFANIQPFNYGSNRIGRLVENILRLNWRMPWKHVPINNEYERFVRDVQTFNTSELPKIVAQAENLYNSFNNIVL